MSPSHSRSRVARAFFAGSARPGACICFWRVASITPVAVSRPLYAFSSRSAAAFFFSAGGGAAAPAQAAMSSSCAEYRSRNRASQFCVQYFSWTGLASPARTKWRRT